MTKILSCSVFLATLVVAASPALAGGSKGAIGVGGEIQLSGVTGVAVNYDAGQFHVGGLVGVFDPDGPNNGSIDLGGHFYWHLASTAMSDFSIGGAIGMAFDRLGNPSGDTGSFVYLEPGFQIRAFIAANVALSFTGGLSLGVGDDKSLSLNADPTGAIGVSYYFF